jgi:hypothetical protein
MSKEGQLLTEEGTLGHLDAHASLTQLIEHVGQIMKVLIESLQEDDDVVDVDKAARPNQPLEEPLHVALEHAWGIRQPHW